MRDALIAFVVLVGLVFYGTIGAFVGVQTHKWCKDERFFDYGGDTGAGWTTGLLWPLAGPVVWAIYLARQILHRKPEAK